MSNSNLTTYITIPVGEEVTKNVTKNFESTLFKLMINTLQHLPKEHYNVAVLILMLCCMMICIVIYIIKCRRLLCHRTNTAERNTP